MNAKTLILYNKLCDQNSQTKESIDKLSTKREIILEFHPYKIIEQTLSALSGLGDVIENVKQSSIVKGTKQDVIIWNEWPLASVSCASDRSYQRDQPQDFNTSNPESIHENETDENKSGHVLVSDSEKKMQFGWEKYDLHSGMVITDEGYFEVKLLTPTFGLTGRFKNSRKGKPKRKLLFRQGNSTPHEKPVEDVLILQKSTDEELMELLRTLNIDTMAECRADCLPAFSHGRSALQGIVTKGTDILDWPPLSATENQMMNCECIWIYSNASLLTKIEASNHEIKKTIDYKENRQNVFFPALVVVKQEHQFMIEDWIQNIRKNIPGICVILVSEGQEQIYFAPEKSIFLSMTKMAEITVAANKLLERAIFGVLRHLVETLMQNYGTSTDLSDSEIESTLQSVYAYARAAYKRSKVPECERPDIPAKTYTYPKTIDEVIKTLLKIQGVVGCSKKCGGLEVLVDNTLDKDTTTDKIKQLLAKEKIGATFEYGRFKHFISPGDDVYWGCGTLGGFAKRFPTTTSQIHNRAKADRTSSLNKPDKQGKLVALISRHVAMACSPKDNTILCVGSDIIGKIHKIPDTLFLDIVPFDIHVDFLKECNTRFQTEAKKQMHGQLPENNDFLIGLPVFIWGAKSSPGLGMLDSIMDMQDTVGVQCIKIHNRKLGEPFSKPGDSGAIVCATDSEGSILTTIAMLIGEFQGSTQPTYLALLLNEAFKNYKNSTSQNLKCVRMMLQPLKFNTVVFIYEAQ